MYEKLCHGNDYFLLLLHFYDIDARRCYTKAVQLFHREKKEEISMQGSVSKVDLDVDLELIKIVDREEV